MIIRQEKIGSKRILVIIIKEGGKG